MQNIILISILLFSIIFSLLTTTREAIGLSDAEKEKYGKLMETKYGDIMNKYDIEFHDSPEKIDKLNEFGLANDTALVYDPVQKKLVALPRPNILSFPTYYTPGTFKHGSASYVPNYQDSVVLSGLTKYKKFNADYNFAEEHAENMRKPIGSK
jgi:hypothetical protein